MGLTALGIPTNMLTSTTSKEDEKLIYKTLEKGEGPLKLLYVTPEKVSKSKRFMSKLEKCHHAGRLSVISVDVSSMFLTFPCEPGLHHPLPVTQWSTGLHHPFAIIHKCALISRICRLLFDAIVHSHQHT